MEDVIIGNKKIGKNSPCFISLEPGATYDNFDVAKKMIEACSESKADAVKFQTFLKGDADRIMGKKDILVNFGTSSGQKQELVYDALKRRELSKNEWIELANYAKELDLLFITAPYFVETVDFLKEMGVDAIKVSKGDINNVLLIEKMAKTKLPIILDAREKIDDVNNAINVCEKNDNKKIVIMHCPSGYPSENAGVHLNAIKYLSENYEYPIGFADHSPGDVMNYAAVSLGANMLEKTITSNKNIEHVEHFMSLELDELKKFVNNVRSIEEALGNSKILFKSRVEENARRSIIAKQKISKGSKIQREDLDFKRPGNIGISCADGLNIINKSCKQDISEGTFLQWEMIE